MKKDYQVNKGVDGKFKSSNSQRNVAEADTRFATSGDGNAWAVLERSKVLCHWILDSGVSFPVTSFREWFQIYKSWDGNVSTWTTTRHVLQLE